MSLLKDFVELLFPKTCYGCSQLLRGNEETLCSSCFNHLPLTQYHFSEEENPIEKLFWGRIDIQQASAYMFFSKGGIVQQLLHNLKYKGHTEIGHLLGELLGEELKQSPKFNDIDLIVPVPLHPSKQKKRGYNQSEEIAKGISKKLQAPVNTQIMVRTKATETQTKKARFDRWQNVDEKFGLKEASFAENKHILLVDDVITTGATIEACAKILLQAKNAKVSVVTLASVY